MVKLDHGYLLFISVAVDRRGDFAGRCLHGLPAMSGRLTSFYGVEMERADGLDRFLELAPASGQRPRRTHTEFSGPREKRFANGLGHSVYRFARRRRIAVQD